MIDASKRQKIGTPNNVDVLLHCHTCPYPHPRIDAPAVKGAIQMLLDVGAIKPHDEQENRYRTTPKGEAWVIAICNTPVPRESYTDENGEILVSI